MQLLVKCVGPIEARNFRVGRDSRPVAVKSSRLFDSIPVGQTDDTAGTWYVLKFEMQANGMSLWDLCHEVVSNGERLSAGRIVFAEPDLLQNRMIFPESRDRLLIPSASSALVHGVGHSLTQNHLWFKDDDHAEFDLASKGLPDPGELKRVRIAHLDTGYDPEHRSRPKFLSDKEQRDFVGEGIAPHDATDLSDGVLEEFSQGAATLALLAGRHMEGSKGFGCAPNAEIIPLRVANRSGMFRTSTVAKALDYVHQMSTKPDTFVHVACIGVGGYLSQCWIEAVNALYEAGVVVVAAAGDNVGNLPSHDMTFPARFNRVIAACGCLPDNDPFVQLGLDKLSGNYGPEEAMDYALCAYATELPWARNGAVDAFDWNGAGTAAAAAQISGAAALWIQKHRSQYDALGGAQRIEAVRSALFSSATKSSEQKYAGQGVLKTAKALKVKAAVPYAETPADGVEHDRYVKLFELESARLPPRMLALEIRQALHAWGMEADARSARTPERKREIVESVERSPSLSEGLRDHLAANCLPKPVPIKIPAAATATQKLNVALAMSPHVAPPQNRRLKVFAYDPSPQTDPALFGLNEAIVNVPWEALEEGPIGEYVEVVDVDPASGVCYAPVDLNHPYLLSTNGHSPSESNPQFHQQMVYAVAMRTIARFERALGRRALWSPLINRDPKGAFVSRHYVQRLRIYPHALRERNAYYSSNKMALLFGYFAASEVFAGNALPGSQIFCAVSHDIIAHETTHALLDGLHPRFQESTNPDVLAFHEAFADIVALFLHFTMPESLLAQIRKTRGDLAQESLLGQLAVQFGEASGSHGGLRSAIGTKVGGKKWRPAAVSRDDYAKALVEAEPHRLGSVLVSAIFAAFMTIYNARSAELRRLVTNGTGVLPKGEISRDLAERLAREASAVADQVLNICIRALDYVPPVDITFGEYLRALITADRDLVPDDPRGYRVAFIAAFRERGIFPRDVRHLAEDSLVWIQPPIAVQSAEVFEQLVSRLKLDWNLNSDRRRAYDTSDENRAVVARWLNDGSHEALLDAMGFERKASHIEISGLTGSLGGIEVHSVRPTRRTSPDGSSRASLVVEITQTFRALPEGEKYRGGCTLIIDLNTNRPKYFIRKRLRGTSGLIAQRRERVAAALRAAQRGTTYIRPGDVASSEAFALLHRC